MFFFIYRDLMALLKIRRIMVYGSVLYPVWFLRAWGGVIYLNHLNFAVFS